MKGLRKQYDQLRERAAKYWSQLQKKGLEHWLGVAILTVLGLLLGQWIGTAEIWQELRYKIYQFQTSRLSIGQPIEWRTVFVLVEDDEYWKGELARRVPIKRNYLAKLLCAVDRANPALIALDFDLRSPVPSGELVEHPAYECERRELLEAVAEVAGHRAVILPKQVSIIGGRYVEESDIFRGSIFRR